MEHVPTRIAQSSGQLEGRKKLLEAPAPGLGPSLALSDPPVPSKHPCLASSCRATSDGMSQSGRPTAGNHTSPLPGAGKVLALRGAAYICVA